MGVEVTTGVCQIGPALSRQSVALSFDTRRLTGRALPERDGCARCSGPSLRLVTDDNERPRWLARAIREAVEATNVKPSDLGSLPGLGVSEKTVYRWMNGEAVPDALQLRPLADALGVSPMLFVDPPKPPVYPLAEYRTGKPMDPAELAAAAAAHGTHDAAEGEERPRLAAVPPVAQPRKRPARTPR